MVARLHDEHAVEGILAYKGTAGQRLSLPYVGCTDVENRRRRHQRDAVLLNFLSDF